MMTKLTLSINSDVVEKAKKALRAKNQSLSKLVEDYFRLLLKTTHKQDVSTPIVKELTGLARNIPKAKKAIYDYLQEKYK